MYVLFHSLWKAHMCSGMWVSVLSIKLKQGLLDAQIMIHFSLKFYDIHIVHAMEWEIEVSFLYTLYVGPVKATNPLKLSLCMSFTY